MKNAILAICGSHLRHVTAFTDNEVVEDTEVPLNTKPTLNMHLHVERTDYVDGETPLAQITGDRPFFQGFRVCCIDQPKRPFVAPAIMFTPHHWPITQDDLNRILKQIFPEFNIKFVADNLPAKKYTGLQITAFRKLPKKGH